MPTMHIRANADPHVEHHLGFFRLNAVGGSMTGLRDGSLAPPVSCVRQPAGVHSPAHPPTRPAFRVTLFALGAS